LAKVGFVIRKWISWGFLCTTRNHLGRDGHGSGLDRTEKTFIA